MNQHARVEERPIPFIDLAAQRRRLGRAIDDAVARVLAHCQFIQGPEVHVLEAELAAFCGARHAIGCASGTDALLLLLMAWEIGPGDAVICPSFTYHATAEMVVLLGATPIIADVLPDTFNLDPASCERAVVTAKRLGLNPRAVIPVDLFGLPADHNAIAAIAAKHSLLVLDDAAQAFGAHYRGKRIGTLAAATATSFFPAKPLGCYGDGGAVFTDDDALAARVKSIRLHGEGVDRSEAARIGITGRLDTIQAAVLIEKLKIFPEEIEARNLLAARYSAALADIAIAPRVGNESTSVWAQYTIRLKAGKRDPLAAALKAQGIPTAIYYTRPLHRQPAYRRFPVAEGGVPISDRLAEEVLSLPMHAYLEPPVQDRIIESIRRALAN
ncbi:MAG TPA: DegT/DnrJ/EryC1/StrS aminotransferase family protein [Xanthobacteraceae bacterium]|jgi:dTDP-4-amino-4,6-dideoxygalactose transaminase|nr:DegT/DnrJ/EryC1/StrS aminotransferase family protein [Xanthobacteraceae bacterium]